ncbi:MAG TPA: hypothetical protein VFW07_28850 [Parafilimonas sp.]|nr:hypothetical protein [Parafilimonas sp.]
MLQNLGTSLSRSEMKNVRGGNPPRPTVCTTCDAHTNMCLATPPWSTCYGTGYYSIECVNNTSWEVRDYSCWE